LKINRARKSKSAKVRAHKYKREKSRRRKHECKGAKFNVQKERERVDRPGSAMTKKRACPALTGVKPAIFTPFPAGSPQASNLPSSLALATNQHVPSRTLLAAVKDFLSFTILGMTQNLRTVKLKLITVCVP
jgi:hypothetical protein